MRMLFLKWAKYAKMINRILETTVGRRIKSAFVFTKKIPLTSANKFTWHERFLHYLALFEENWVRTAVVSKEMIKVSNFIDSEIF